MNSHHKTEIIQTQINHVGIDVSKLHLDVSIAEMKTKRFPNSSKGIEELVKKISGLPKPCITCESTGGYEMRLVNSLHEAAIPVAIASPGRVRYFAKAEGLIAKTDAIDAQLIRRFAEKITIHRHQKPSPQAQRLREMTDSRRFLCENITQIQNRLELAQGYKKEILLAQLTQAKELKEKVEKDIQNHLKEFEELGKKAARLQELKGVGPVLATTILAQLPEIGNVSDKTIACIVGVAPHPKQSGNYVGKSSIRGGRAAIRHVLYMGAVTAIRSNPILKAFYERLRQSGKSTKIAIVAVMRKMLCVLNKLVANPEFSLAH